MPEFAENQLIGFWTTIFVLTVLFFHDPRLFEYYLYTAITFIYL